ncbi:acid sphingomyelinase-like phosphodiesterase 3b [Anthonomus grandis grandis]|uniref:acid sphingomyelinase-like phosphodiesterase 3b n=1 Tax=Anthonomus grandis grandis TaxID=2921223 RepID=UPI002166806E|nr:acid sphingomyelinase-like phosphodiesterase 3b [Anthonomus grandis grandis]
MLCGSVKIIFLCLVTLGLPLVVKGRGELYEKIAYFWHITDIHYDGHYSSYPENRKSCWRTYDPSNSRSKSQSQRSPSNPYGDYNCDSTWDLIESAARMMMSRQNENVEFVLWTGDAISHHAMRHLKEEKQLEIIQNVTDLLRKTFSSQFVFPALGHDDPLPRKELGKMWRQWLPTDAMKMFETGGYYFIERKTQKLQIVVLNTNLMKRQDDNDEEALRQWRWLEEVLEKFKKNGQKVYFVGHVPPGTDERHKGITAPNHIMYRDHHNKRYLQIVRKYHSMIVGQFFGHLHSDTFRVFYSENGRPISWSMLAPSITPKRNHDGPNNPGLRIYKFDRDSGQVFDYTQYYLDLSAANSNGKAEWVVEYNFSTYYGINDITPLNLHTLADKFTQESGSGENGVFTKYYKANSVRINNKASYNCDDTCAHMHYCAITRIDYEEHEQCLKIAASALASSSSYLVLGTVFRLLLTGSFCLVFRFAD